MAGQPQYYKTPEEMQIAIDKYFDSCSQSEGEIKPTVTGLALALGFASRQSLIDYEEKGEFFYTVKIAKLRVENYIEQRLYEANATGSIFNLKNNFAWKDKTEVDTNVTYSDKLDKMKNALDE